MRKLKNTKEALKKVKGNKMITSLLENRNNLWVRARKVMIIEQNNK